MLYRRACVPSNDQNLIDGLSVFRELQELHGIADIILTEDRPEVDSSPVSVDNEMQKYIGTIPCKTLSTTRKQLEADNLIHREEYPQIPPKVEYSLTDKGKSPIPILDQMCSRGDSHRD